MHPVGVRQHVPAHQSKDDHNNYSGHDPHYPHFGFFTVMCILLYHRFLFFPRSIALALAWRRYNIAGNLIVRAYSSLTGLMNRPVSSGGV
jgi:hypothetical protein